MSLPIREDITFVISALSGEVFAQLWIEDESWWLEVFYIHVTYLLFKRLCSICYPAPESIWYMKQSTYLATQHGCLGCFNTCRYKILEFLCTSVETMIQSDPSIIMISWHGNIFHVTGPLWVTDGFPSLRTSNAELGVFFVVSLDQGSHAVLISWKSPFFR